MGGSTNKSYQINSISETIYTTLNTFVAHFFGFLTVIIIAQWLSLSDLGLYFVLFSVTLLITQFGQGMGIGMKKRLSEFTTGKLTYIIIGSSLWTAYATVLTVVFIISEPYVSQISLTLFETIGFILLFFARGYYLLLHESLSGLGKPSLAEKIRIFFHVKKFFFQVVLLFFGYELAGVLIGAGIGYILASFILSYYYALSTNITAHRDVRVAIQDLLSFSKWSILSRFADSFNYQVLIITIFVIISVDSVGLVEASMRVAAVLSLFGFAVRRALVPKISATHNINEAIEPITTNIYKYTSLLIPPVIFGGILFQTDLLIFLYGNNFNVGAAGQIFVLSLVYTAVQTYRIVNDGILYAINKPNTVFKINVLTGAVLSITVLPVAVFSESTGLVILTASIIETVRTATQYYSLTEFITIPIKKIATTISVQGIAAVLMSIVVYTAEKLLLFIGLMHKIPILIILGGILYISLIYYLDDEIKEETNARLKSFLQ